MARLLDEAVTAQVSQIFEKQLTQPVEVAYFSAEACEYCEETRQLLEEVTSISDKLSLKVYDIKQDQALADQYGVDKTPGFVLLGRDDDRVVDYGVRFYGIPSGHEFGTLIHTLTLVSGRDSGLDPKTRQALKELKDPVHLQVFVTPT